MRSWYLPWFVPFVLVVLLLAACSGSSDESADTTLAPTTTETTTTVAPTTTVAMSAAVIGVSFDGERCEVDTESVPAGGHAFVVTNDSDHAVALYVSSLVDGHTFDELLELQEEVGGSPNSWPKPDWVVYESPSPEPDARPEVELSDNQFMEARRLTEGTDAVYLAAFVPGPERIWFCAPLSVTAPEA
jgi:hypothetical protein